MLLLKICMTRHQTLPDIRSTHGLWVEGTRWISMFVFLTTLSNNFKSFFTRCLELIILKIPWSLLFTIFYYEERGSTQDGGPKFKTIVTIRIHKNEKHLIHNNYSLEHNCQTFHIVKLTEAEIYRKYNIHSIINHKLNGYTETTNADARF